MKIKKYAVLSCDTCAGEQRKSINESVHTRWVCARSYPGFPGKIILYWGINMLKHKATYMSWQKQAANSNTCEGAGILLET